MDHDTGYKLLFSHPDMVADLLRGFVREGWVTDLDFSTLERVNASYVSDDLRGRADDLVWRLRWREGWLYVYLLLEFQSRVDPFMALRLLVYLGLLYQDLVRGQQLTPNGKLPPVLPLVLYNGRPRWTAATELADLIETPPGDLIHYRPRLRYLLLEANRYPAADLAPLRNLSAALFQLENSRGPADVQRVVATLVERLQAPEQNSLRRAFAVWLRRVLLPARMPGVVLSEINDLQEMNAMLAERVLEWTEEWKQQGMQEGLRQGMRQGLQQGEALLLRRLLERKFGPLDPVALARLERADPDLLLLWGERVLTAATLAEVLAE
jgi:predicted transposase/invertase (TIGR01784 family)